MSNFETKTADNFVYAESLDPREHISDSTPFLAKNVSYVSDASGGSSTFPNGEVIIDSQSIASSGSLLDWCNGYLAIPYSVKWDLKWATVPIFLSTATSELSELNRYALAMKNFAILDSLKVEAGGRTILTTTTGLADLCNYKAHVSSTPSSLFKDSSTTSYFPDSAVTGANSVSNDTSATGFKINHGLAKRQSDWLPTPSTLYMSGSQIKEEGASIDLGSAITIATTTQTPSDIHFVAIIKLKDIADLFGKHPLSRGVSYKFTLRFNQSVTVLNHAAEAWKSPVLASAGITQRSGTSQPAMFCCGENSILGRLSFATPGISPAAVSTITSSIDTSSNAPFSGIRLYVPSYECDAAHQEKLLSQPPIHKQFMDFSTVMSQGYTAPGATINLQVSTSAVNPRCLIIIPRWSQTPNTDTVNGQGFYSRASPLSTVPGTTDALLSLTNLQITMGSKHVLSDRVYYSFQNWLDHSQGIFANDGNNTNMTSGVIDKRRFELNHRYYAFDLSRYPESMSNLPQMISLECKNNSIKAVELQCILLYSRDVEFNLAAGSLTITA